MTLSFAVTWDYRCPFARNVHEVAPELVAWGEALHAAVRISAASASGEFVLPPLAFAP